MFVNKPNSSTFIEIGAHMLPAHYRLPERSRGETLFIKVMLITISGALSTYFMLQTKESHKEMTRFNLTFFHHL